MTVTTQAPALPRSRTAPDSSERSRTPPKAPAAQAAKPSPLAAPSRRRGVTPLTPMRREAAKSMRKLAASVQESHPDMTVHDHIRDAAKTLESGNEEGAQQHLRAAMFALTPQSLMRNGIHTDDAHIAARQAMHRVHRHLLLAKNIADAGARNREAIAKLGSEDDTAPRPQQDPNNGYGPGALAQKPTARQPPGDQALNAPAKADGGGSDPNAADPDGPQPKGSKQFAYGWDDLCNFIALTGDAQHRHIPGSPYIYEHNYVPLTEEAARSHFGGKVPKGWSAPPGGKKTAPTAQRPEAPRAPQNADHAATAQKIADNVRFEPGLTRGQKEEAEQRLYKAAKHLNAGNHEEAASELDATMHATSLRGGGIIKGSTAAQARDLRDKVRASGGSKAPSGAKPPAQVKLPKFETVGPGPVDRGQGTADQITMLYGMKQRRALASQTGTDDLKAADKEFTRRAALLGRAGQVSPMQKVVRDEIARRKAGGTQQLAVTRGDLDGIVELVGPHGYIHGWIFVGVPGVGAEVSHPQHGHGTVTASGGGRVQVSFDAGHSKTFPVRSQQGPGHFEAMTDDELADEYERSQGSRASAIVGEMGKRDQRDQQAKAQRVKGLYAEKPKTEADRNRVYQGLVNEGEDPEEAWQHAYSTNPEAMHKQSVIAQLRDQGYRGSGFEALSRAAYKDDVRRRTVQAENATNGYMLNPKGKQAGVDPYSLFTGPESRARKYASPELKEWWDQNGRPTAADFQASLMGKKAGMKPADFYAAVTWDDVLNVLEFSAKTAALEVTPALYGKPGGPGLYGVAGQKHSDYFEQLVKAFTEKRGMDKAGASRMAWGALRRWAAGGGHVTPEVRAAASKALAEEEGKAHAHAASWDQVARDIELSTVIELFNPAQPRVAAGTATAGQFAPAGSQPAAQPAAAKQTPAQKAAAAAAAKAKAAHAAHVAHVAHVNGVSSKKAELQVTAQDDRQKAAGLIKQRNVLEQELQSAAGKTSSGQAGSTTSANATTSSSAPATTASTAPASTTAASTASSTAPASSAAPASTASAGSAAAIKAQIGQLNTQINQLLAQAKQAETQAATMK